ncbi:MAG: UDP-N-acetylmuramoyl-tripeptide--D-alanyl-D-alanine ligase [Bacteroidaceae bacterium]|nr:UDP-N-acetylmuramoyl-tripeptide--D-alanyl-D-alanine ligase [Bacteroidaceae bacterium]
MYCNTKELYDLYLAHPCVTTDSRRCPEGSIFFALKGASFDGNAFAAKALEAGCALAVVDEPEYATDERFLLVHNVLEALQELAAHHRREWGKPVLQITGTNGKTTTKELVAAVLSKRHNVLYTEGNLNNHIGVPLTLLRLRPEHDIAVVETGANHPGEIAFLCRIAQADCGIVTNVGRAHLEGFGSFEGVKATKGELYDDLHRRGKFIFLNAFDDDLREMALQRGFVLEKDALPYVEARVEDTDPFLRLRWRAELDSPWHDVQTHLVGAYNIENVRAAVTVGLHFGVGEAQIDEALSAYRPTNGRSEYRETPRGNRLIIDAYNANLTSMQAALTNFQFVRAERKLAILGEMRELGQDSAKAHEEIVRTLIAAGIEAWLVGQEFAHAAPADGSMRLFANVEEVKEALRKEPIEGYTLLIKGSNGTRLHELPAADVL